MDEAKGGNHMVSIDLEAQTVISPSGKTFSFQIDPQRKDKMLRGLDAIGETLLQGADIDLYREQAGAGPSRGWKLRSTLGSLSSRSRSVARRNGTDA